MMIVSVVAHSKDGDRLLVAEEVAEVTVVVQQGGTLHPSIRYRRGANVRELLSRLTMRDIPGNGL